MDSVESAICAVCSMEVTVDAYVERRDGLAYRRLKGDDLSADEESELETINAALRLMLPTSEALPPHVQDAIELANELVARS